MRKLTRRTAPDELSEMLKETQYYHEYYERDPQLAAAYWDFIKRVYTHELGYTECDFQELSFQADAIVAGMVTELTLLQEVR